MLSKFVSVAAVLSLTVLLASTAARADVYNYEFHLNGTVGFGMTYGPGDFSVDSSSLLDAVNDTASSNPAGDIDGFKPVSIYVSSTIGGSDALIAISFTSEPYPGTACTSYLQVCGFGLPAIGAAAATPGTYTTNQAIFEIGSTSAINPYTIYTPGTLTITDTSVPEPSSLVVVTTGALLLGAAVKRAWV